MGFGETSRGFNDWALDDAGAKLVFRQAVDLGITLWDTANVYGYGSSEEIVGRAVRRCTRREDVVLATKLHYRMHAGPGGSGLSRKAVMEQVDASLTRLGTDYVDLYQIHRFDPDTPVEETMEALHDVVKAGKARYLGASSMWAWQFSKLQYTATLHGWTRFVSMQNQYNLMQREEEREMLGLLADQGVGSIPWSPLAKGRLARPFGAQTRRFDSDPVGRRFFGDGDRSVVDAVQRVAEDRGIPMLRSPWPGCSRTRSWSRRSWGRPRRTTSPTRPRRWRCTSPTTRSGLSRSPTRPESRRASDTGLAPDAAGPAPDTAGPRPNPPDPAGPHDPHRACVPPAGHRERRRASGAARALHQAPGSSRPAIAASTSPHACHGVRAQGLRTCSSRWGAGMGRRVEVRADLSRVQIRCDGRSVADHERFWVRHQREGLVSSGPGGYRQAARAGR